MSGGTEQLRAFWQRSVRLAHLFIALGAVALYFGLRDGRAAALGLILGGAASVLRFNLRYRALLRLGAVGPLVRVRLMTYALNAAVLAVAFGFRETISPWTTATGLLAMNAAVIAAELLDRSKSPGGTRSAARSGPGRPDASSL